MNLEDLDLGDMDGTDLEELRKQIEEEQRKRSNRKAVALDLKRKLEDLVTSSPDVFRETFTAEGVEGCPTCVHVPIGEPDYENDPHLQYEK